LNRTDIFGNQIIFDDNDLKTDEMERMLIAPVKISFDALFKLTHKHYGAFVPAHIDRSSFSVISNLGFLPPHLDIHTVEISPEGAKSGFDKLNSGIIANKNVVFSSDAHQLSAIGDKNNFLLLPELTARAAIDFLR